MRLRAGLLLADDGISLFIALAVLLVSSLLAAATLVAAQGDITSTHKSAQQRNAYYAALAGIEAYQFHLNAEPNYWQTCTGIPETHVEGSPEETYSVKILPASGHTECKTGEAKSVIQNATKAGGNTFRIESTGEAKSATKTFEKRRIVATFGPPSFLDYVYVSNYEVEDPVTYEENKRPKNCEHYYAERLAHGWTSECKPIEFVSADKVEGPMHTNDAAAICGSPTFGRGATDSIEMNGGYYEASRGCGASPSMKGSYSDDGPTLLPPSSDSQLATLAGYKFAGETFIKLIGSKSPNEIEVKNASFNGGAWYKEAFPTDGVIYVEPSSSGCSVAYTPFNTKYESESGCGNVYVAGSYTESLTIAAAEDVVIDGNITTTTKESKPEEKPEGNATLGLIASNFVRIYHPVKCSNSHGCTNAAGSEECTEENASGSLDAPIIDAAILTTAHSFIVDNYKCGKALGTLTIWGAIAQNWRGPVATVKGEAVSTGYAKNYDYDERLATEQPPDFLAPSENVWRVMRETVVE